MRPPSNTGSTGEQYTPSNNPSSPQPNNNPLKPLELLSQQGEEEQEQDDQQEDHQLTQGGVDGHFCLHCVVDPCVCDLVKLELKIKLLRESLPSPQQNCSPQPQLMEPSNPPPPTNLQHHQPSSTASLLSSNIFVKEDRKKRLNDMDPEIRDPHRTHKKQKIKTHLRTSSQSPLKNVSPGSPASRAPPSSPAPPPKPPSQLTKEGCMNSPELRPSPSSQPSQRPPSNTGGTGGQPSSSSCYPPPTSPPHAAFPLLECPAEPSQRPLSNTIYICYDSNA